MREKRNKRVARLVFETSVRQHCPAAGPVALRNDVRAEFIFAERFQPAAARSEASCRTARRLLREFPARPLSLLALWEEQTVPAQFAFTGIWKLNLEMKHNVWLGPKQTLVRIAHRGADARSADYAYCTAKCPQPADREHGHTLMRLGVGPAESAIDRITSAEDGVACS